MQIDEEYFRSEEFQELLESYETSVETGDTPFLDVDDLVDLADYFSWKRDDKQAEQVIALALELYPDATLPNVFRARRALEKEDYAAARAYAEQIGNHDDPDYHYLMAEIMISEGDVEGADRYLHEYGKTVEADEQEDFFRDCANLFIDYNVSEKAYEWIMRSHGDNSEDYKELMGRTLLALGKYSESERIFNELLDRQPFSTNYWNALATAQLMTEDFSDAITSSEYAIAINPNDADAFINKGNALLRIGNYEEAVKCYKRYSELEPDDESGPFYQGICLTNTGRTREAIEVLEHAYELAPDNSIYLAQICQDLAFAYSADRQVDKALEMLDKTKTLDCDHVDMMVVRGHILLQNGYVKEAEDAFTKAIKHSNNAPAVLLRIIVSLYDNHYLNACYQMLLKFLAMTREYYPQFTDGNAYMALCCYDLRRTDEFMKYLRIAVDQNPYEAQQVLSCLFPDEMPVSNYVKYMEEKFNIKN